MDCSEILECIYARPADGSEHYVRHFRNCGNLGKPPENMVNSLANTFLSLKHFDEAFYLFRLNDNIYPESYNVYNAMGDFYSAEGDKPNAILNYTKALTIKEVPAVRNKLEKLQKK